MKPCRLLLCLLLVIAGHFSRGAEDPGEDADPMATPPYYIYALGSAGRYHPPSWASGELHDGSGSTGFSPVMGGGFAFINFWDRGYLNVELDYTTGSFDTTAVTNRKVGNTSLNFLMKWKVSTRGSLAVFGGMGLGFMHHSDYFYTDPDGERWRVERSSELTIGLIAGASLGLTRRIQLRGEFRFYGPPEDEGDWEGDDDIRYISFSAGLEIHI